MASAEVTAYFSWRKFPGKRLSDQIESIKTFFGNRWDSLSFNEQEEIIDDYFVDSEIRRQYGEDSSSEFPPSFPKLMIPSGEKIMVDENDLRTWRDAHSGPFSWKSKSQQDLTMADYEPENICKPPTKGKKSRSGNSESENGEDAPKERSAAAQFVYSEERWTREMLAEYRAHLETRSPSKSASRASSPLEEDNAAFVGSVVDIRGPPAASDPSSNHTEPPSQGNVSSSRSNSPEKSSRSNSVDKLARSNSVQKSLRANSVEKSSRSNSPEKSSRSKSPGPRKVSFSKSFQKTEDSETKDKLISREKVEESNVFCNPAMANEWSTFVGQNTEETHEVPAPVSNEPPVLTMDRGAEVSDQSVESTPDHTSKLLPNSVDIAKAETEEFLFVAVDTSDTVDKADLRKSGFDFLDDW